MYFEYEQPEVIELHLKMTTPVKQIQMAVLDLITETVQVCSFITVSVYICVIMMQKIQIHWPTILISIESLSSSCLFHTC